MHLIIVSRNAKVVPVRVASPRILDKATAERQLHDFRQETTFAAADAPFRFQVWLQRRSAPFILSLDP